MSTDHEKISATDSVKSLTKQTSLLINNYFLLIKNIQNLMLLEAKLALQSVLTIMLCFLGIAILSTTIWLSLSLATGFVLIKLGFSFIDCCFLLILINFLVMGVLFITIKQLRQNLSFSATKQVLTEKPQRAS